MQNDDFTVASLDNLAAVTGGAGFLDSAKNVGQKVMYGGGFASGAVERGLLGRTPENLRKYATAEDDSLAQSASNGYSRAGWQGVSAGERYMWGNK